MHVSWRICIYKILSITNLKKTTRVFSLEIDYYAEKLKNSFIHLQTNIKTCIELTVNNEINNSLNYNGTAVSRISLYFSFFIFENKTIYYYLKYYEITNRIKKIKFLVKLIHSVGNAANSWSVIYCTKNENNICKK